MNPQIAQMDADFFIPSNSTGLERLVETDQLSGSIPNRVEFEAVGKGVAL